jgi:hypothetical protein
MSGGPCVRAQARSPGGAPAGCDERMWERGRRDGKVRAGRAAPGFTRQDTEDAYWLRGSIPSEMILASCTQSAAVTPARVRPNCCLDSTGAANAGGMFGDFVFLDADAYDTMKNRNQFSAGLSSAICS